jgi:anti-sigma regulatory factor (Ser/Thr protein kinase)
MLTQEYVQVRVWDDGVVRDIEEAMGLVQWKGNNYTESQAGFAGGSGRVDMVHFNPWDMILLKPPEQTDSSKKGR